MKGKVLLFIILILLLANAYIFLNKDRFVYTNQVSYAWLYPHAGNNPVSRVSIINDSAVKIVLKDTLPKATAWYQAVNGTITDSNIAGSPVVQLKQGINDYNIFRKGNADTFFCRMEYIPAAGSASYIAMYKNNFNELALSEVHGFKNYNDAINKNELLELDAILRDSMKIAGGMTDEETVTAIGKYLYKTIYPMVGTPNAETLAATAFQQYKKAAAGQKIWCGIYAGIFNLFAGRAGLTTRSIEFKNNDHTINGPVHVINEYFSMQRKQWVAVDIMYNNIKYEGTDGKLLNAVQAKNTDAADTGVKIYHASRDSVIVRPFAEMPALFFDFYGREKDCYIYNSNINEEKGLKRLVKYVSPSQQYFYYSDTAIADNRNFLIKQIMFYLLLIFGTAGFLYLLFNFLKMRK